MTKERECEILEARAEILEKRGYFDLADALREQAYRILLQQSASRGTAE